MALKTIETIHTEREAGSKVWFDVKLYAIKCKIIAKIWEIVLKMGLKYQSISCPGA